MEWFLNKKYTLIEKKVDEEKYVPEYHGLITLYFMKSKFHNILKV